MKSRHHFVGIRVLALLCFLTVGIGDSLADPPVIPVTPPPLVPCNPLICLQLIDAIEVTPENWRFEFEALNWTAFTDRPCLPTDPNCVDRSSSGSPAVGLVFVRNAALSSVSFRVLPVDPNGAPLGIVSEVEDLQVGNLPGGDTGVDLARGFVAQILSVVDLDTNGVLPASCYALTDPYEGILTFVDDPICQPLVNNLDEVRVSFDVFLGPDNVDPNKWQPNVCTEDQIIWTQDPDMPMPIPPGDTNVRPSCPVTCQDKDSLGNVLQGFVVEVEDFGPNDRLVFNWYLLGPGGPIASGSPPTPTDSGTLGPSPSDPWGFSFGSFQIDGKDSCQDGSCDTTILVDPPVTDPTLSCLVDEDLDRNALPFDFYVSLSPAGTDPPCRIEPAIERDERGIERLVVRATAGTETDRLVVTFENLDTGVVTTESLSLTAGSANLSTEDLLGRYEVSGICENTVTSQFFFLESFDFAVPRRGDRADLVSTTQAYEIDEAAGTLALTETFAGGALNLGAVAEIYHFFQVTDVDGVTQVIGSADGAPDSLFRNGPLLVHDTAVPQIFCVPTVSLGTQADDGQDCSVPFTAAARATDAAGGFVLSESLNGTSTRSFGTTVDGAEEANLATSGTVSVGTPVDVIFQAVDDAGQSSGQCTTTVTVADDTPPVVQCALIEQQGGNNGGGNGQGPGGGGPPGQGGGNNGGGPPNNLPNSGFFLVEFAGSDNCQPGFGLTLDADINGFPVNTGDDVQIVDNGTSPTTGTPQPDGSIRIDTTGPGVLTVTATDQAGNVSVCTASSI